MSGTNSPQGGLTRRSFLKTTAAVAGAASLAGGAGAMTALAAGEGGPDVESKTTYSSTECRGNCGTYCPQRIAVREGKVVHTSMPEYPDGGDKFGHLCIKGMTMPQRVYDPKRLKYPMKRATWSEDDPHGENRGSDEWVRITWDEAIDSIARKFGKAIDEYGGTAIAMWTGYGSFGYLNGSMLGHISVGWGRFLSRFGTTVLDSGADRTLMYLGPIIGTECTSTDGFTEARTVLIWGGNPGEAMQPHWRYIAQAHDKGATVITIDPQFSQSAAHSDVYVPIIPGTDGALMLAICNIMWENGWVDEDHLRFNTVAPFLLKKDETLLRLGDLDGESATSGAETLLVWDEEAQTYGLASEVKSPALMGSFVIDGVEYRTVLDATLERIAEFTPAKASQITGVSEEMIRYIAEKYACQKPAAIYSNFGLSHHTNSRHTYRALALMMAISGNASKVGTGGTVTGFGVGPQDFSYCFAYKDKFQLDSFGGAFPRIMREGKMGQVPMNIKCVWFINGNPIANEIGRLAIIDAIKTVDFVVGQDMRMTETLEYADIVLPIPSPPEVLDFQNVGTFPYAKPSFQAIDPMYECKTDMDIYRLISAALGEPDLYPMSDEEYLRASLDLEVNRINHATWDDYVPGELGPSLEFANPMPVVKYADGYPNEVGRLQFYLENPVPRYDFGDPIDYDLERFPIWVHPDIAYKENPDVVSGKYPLLAISERRRYSVHATHSDIPWMRELDPEPQIRISEADAKERGIEYGDYVKVYNDLGYAVLKARVTKGIMPGVVSLPHHWQRHQFVEGHTQNLISEVFSQMDCNSAFYDVICQVEKHEGSVK